MSTYNAPLNDIRFTLFDLLDAEALFARLGKTEATRDIVDAVLEESARFAETVLTPLNRVGDEIGCKYDKATVFLDNLPFPTGVTAWGKGVFICAAPDILYARDTDGDGKADKVERVFSGFDTDNYQARVNSLSLGLDNWIYAANGLRGAVVGGLVLIRTAPPRGRRRAATTPAS